MLDEIIKRVHNLTQEQQRDVLEYLCSLSHLEKREFPRKETLLSIDVVAGERTIQTDTRDISASGVFINSEGKLNKGLNVRVAFSIPGQDKPFKLNGVISRTEPTGIAIQFKDLNPDSKTILNNAISKDFQDLIDSFEDKIFFRIEIAK